VSSHKTSLRQSLPNGRCGRDDQLPAETTALGEPWRVWLVMGGRGAGKTRAGAEWVRAKALGLEPLGEVAPPASRSSARR
jgi:phage terminase large subunit-like protein